MKTNWYEGLITFLAYRNNINTEVKFDGEFHTQKEISQTKTQVCDTTKL